MLSRPKLLFRLADKKGRREVLSILKKKRKLASSDEKQLFSPNPNQYHKKPKQKMFTVNIIQILQSFPYLSAASFDTWSETHRLFGIPFPPLIHMAAESRTPNFQQKLQLDFHLSPKTLRFWIRKLDDLPQTIYSTYFQFFEIRAYLN